MKDIPSRNIFLPKSHLQSVIAIFKFDLAKVLLFSRNPALTFSFLPQLPSSLFLMLHSSRLHHTLL